MKKQTLTDPKRFGDTLSKVQKMLGGIEKRKEEVKAGKTGEGYLVFSVCGQKLAVKAEYVDGLEWNAIFNRLPGAPERLGGIYSSRGELLPVFKLEKILGFKGKTGRIVMALKEGKKRLAFFTGIPSGMVYREKDEIAGSDKEPEGIISQSIQVEGDKVPLLDVNKLFSSELVFI